MPALPAKNPLPNQTTRHYGDILMRVFTYPFGFTEPRAWSEVMR